MKDGPQGAFCHRGAPDCGWHRQQPFLDVGSQTEHLHDLTDACPGDPLTPGYLCLGGGRA